MKQTLPHLYLKTVILRQIFFLSKIPLEAACALRACSVVMMEAASIPVCAATEMSTVKMALTKGAVVSCSCLADPVEANPCGELFLLRLMSVVSWSC